VAAVDTNVRRVIERRDGVRRGPRALARRAAELLPAGRAAAWNQAMMELGATVCRPRRPACGECPLRRGCAGPDALPPPVRRRRGERFEATDRWARGRILAALVKGSAPPRLGDDRRERALVGLERDGLIVRGPDGEPRLP
jgi:A/G-specific adenine glycosylase